MSNNTFTLEIEGFRGPLGLLLDLIEQRKLHVNDISLATVASEYIQYIENSENVPLSETAQFVVVASTLLLIKSKSLLPTIELTDDEEDDIRDLEERLRQYAKTREASRLLKKRWGVYSLVSKHSPKREVVFTPGNNLSSTGLTQTIHTLLDSLPTIKKKVTAHIMREISLDEVIDGLTIRMQRVLKDSFKNITSKAEKIEAIVNFLALLELVKRGTLRAQQGAHFEDITLEHDATEYTPHYG